MCLSHTLRNKANCSFSSLIRHMYPINVFLEWYNGYIDPSVEQNPTKSSSRDVSLRSNWTQSVKATTKKNAEKLWIIHGSLILVDFCQRVFFFCVLRGPSANSNQTEIVKQSSLSYLRTIADNASPFVRPATQTPVTKINYLEPRGSCHQRRSGPQPPAATTAGLCLHPSCPIPLKGWNLKDMIYGAPRTDWLFPFCHRWNESKIIEYGKGIPGIFSWWCVWCTVKICWWKCHFDAFCVFVWWRIILGWFEYVSK